MPRLVEIKKAGKHVGLLSTTDDHLIELIIALLNAHGGGFRANVLSKGERPPDHTPFLDQFFKKDADKK